MSDGVSVVVVDGGVVTVADGGECGPSAGSADADDVFADADAAVVIDAAMVNGRVGLDG